MSDEDFDIDDYEYPAAPGKPAGLPKTGPFNVDPVDPLVYRRIDDIPETRPAASALGAGQRLTVREEPPKPPAKREYAEWTPGGQADIPQPMDEFEQVGMSPLTRTLVVVAIVLVPLLLVALAVRYAASLYGTF